MELHVPLTRSLNSSSSESSIDSGFESPKGKFDQTSPLDVPPVPPSSLSEAITTSCSVSEMLVSELARSWTGGELNWNENEYY